MNYFYCKGSRAAKFALGLTLITALVACGVGDGNSILQLSGTAATGLALDDATVTVSCVSGKGNATTAPNGSYSLTIAGTGPCIIRVTKGNVSLSSFSTGTGNSTVNVTPLTNAAVQYFQALTGATSPESMLTIPAAKALLSNPAAVQERITNGFVPFVQNTLGVAIKGVNFLTATIVPPNGNVDGNAADVDLELFKTVTTDTGTLPPETLGKLNTKALADVVLKPLPPAVTGLSS